MTTSSSPVQSTALIPYVPPQTTEGFLRQQIQNIYNQGMRDSFAIIQASHRFNVRPLTLQIPAPHKRHSFLDVLRQVATVCSFLTVADAARLSCANTSTKQTLGNHLKSLTSFKPSDPLTFSDADLIALVQRCPELTTIDLGDCSKITDAGVLALAQHCPLLTTIRLWGCNQITNVGLEALARGCHQLIEIDLASCDLITDDGLQDFGEFCPQLTSIDCSGSFGINNIALGTLGLRCPLLTNIVTARGGTLEMHGRGSTAPWIEEHPC